MATPLGHAIGLVVFCALIKSMAAVTAADAPATAELRVLVKGLVSNKGRVRFRLFGTADTYNRQDEAFREEFVAISNRMSQWVVKGVPAQVYSVVVYHDENANGKFDRNFLGIPEESYGFSNNIRPKFAQPEYEDVKFKVVPPVTHIEIEAQR